MTIKALALGAMTAAALSLSMVAPAMADDSSAKEEVKEAGRDIKKGAKKAGRKVQDETCEMVHGKMECAGKRAKNGLKNAGDEVKDAVNAD